MVVTVEHLSLPSSVIGEFNNRTFLVYSGVQVNVSYCIHPLIFSSSPLSPSPSSLPSPPYTLQRLARNTLMNALHRHSLYPLHHIHRNTGRHIVTNLRCNAEDAYLSLKAGLQPGVGSEPGGMEVINKLSQALNR
jgi:hypothetical protein